MEFYSPSLLFSLFTIPSIRAHSQFPFSSNLLWFNVGDLSIWISHNIYFTSNLFSIEWRSPNGEQFQRWHLASYSRKLLVTVEISLFIHANKLHRHIIVVASPRRRRAIPPIASPDCSRANLARVSAIIVLFPFRGHVRKWRPSTRLNRARKHLNRSLIRSARCRGD